MDKLCAENIHTIKNKYYLQLPWNCVILHTATGGSVKVDKPEAKVRGVA